MKGLNIHFVRKMSSRIRLSATGNILVNILVKILPISAEAPTHPRSAGLPNYKSVISYRQTGLVRTNVRPMTTNTRIPNQDRWERNYSALAQFVAREGNALVPAAHVELYEGRNTPIGAWVGYMRQRNRAGMLSPERRQKLESLKGWQWGPLRPGPASNTDRDQKILEMRSQGVSLQTIAQTVGVSRQRVHQISRRQNG